MPRALTAFHRGRGNHKLSNCLACHVAHTWKVKGTRCIDCHRNIYSDSAEMASSQRHTRAEMAMPTTNTAALPTMRAVGLRSNEIPAILRDMRPPYLARLALISALVSARPMLAQSSMTGATCGADTVELHTATGVLYGSLKCPSTPAPWPVAVIIAGSGPTDRDGNTPLLAGKNNSLLMIADGLATKGIASLRYDKRGIGASRGAAVSEADLRFDMYADDAASWAHALQGDKRFSTVTIVGHSEGSLLGMLATMRANADAYVSLEGAGRAAGVVIHEQLSRQLPPDMLADADKVIATLTSGQTTPNFPAALASLFRPSVQPYLASWFQYDPAEEIKRLTVPVLIVQGTTDIQVSMDDAHALAAAKPTATMLTVQGMNHVLKMVPTLDQATQMKAYADPTLPVAPQVIDAISSLIHGVRHRAKT